ncbi:MAG: class I tRNA ligase family protein, partial [Bacteroidota bacterium]
MSNYQDRKKVNCRYSFNAIEEKWITKEKNKEINFKENKKNWIYLLEMLPYPSGKIHMGHVRNYEIADILRRYFYLKGMNVFRPMGWDAFGLPAENAAIENNTQPSIWTHENIKNMKDALEKIGFWYNWEAQITTCNVDYYKHQQEIFLDFYNAGFISRKKDWVNWDPVDKTVLSNEQVDENGKSWRSGAIVEKKEIEQWFLNISKSAKELLEDLDILEGNWPDNVIKMQKNWIGKSIGYIIKFKYQNDYLEVYTTTPEVVFGCTFLAISPESPKAMEINREETLKYINTPKEKRQKVIIGYAFNEYNEMKIPIYIADYVISTYGTGIVMGVPIYSEVDDIFAEKNN